MKSKTIVRLITSIILFLCGCNFYGDIDLGDGYYLWRDGRYKEISYRPSQGKNNQSYSLMHKNVSSYSFSDSAIFITSVRYLKNDKKSTEYYMIKKQKSLLDECVNNNQINSIVNSIVIPVKDSASFYAILKRQQLQLKQ